MRAHLVSLACLAACLSSPAHAEAVATASLGNLTFTLIDLDVNDGIAPAFSFLGAPGNDLAYTYSVHSLVGGYESLSGVSTGFGSPLSKEVRFPDASAALQVDDSNGRYGLGAQGTSTGGANFSAALGFNPFNTAIELTGNTQLIISGDATVFTRVDGHVSTSCVYYDMETDSCAAYGLSGSFSSATASMTLSGPTGAGGTSYSTSTRSASSSAASAYRDGEPLFQDHSGQLAVSFATLSGDTQALNFSLTLVAAGTSLAVPEPGGWTLALAGLVACGALQGATRQHRRQAA